MAAKGQPKTGGRQKGTPNKLTASAAETFGKLRFDPIRKLVDIARRYERMVREIDAQEKKTPGFKLENYEAYYDALNRLVPIYDKLLPYAYPKRKAIELGLDDEMLEVFHRWGSPPDEWETGSDGDC